MTQHLPELPYEEPEQSQEAKPLLSNAMYDRLKNLNLMVVPAVGAFYFGLSKIWGFPKGEEVVGTLALVATFVSVVLLWANARYAQSGAKYDGTIRVTETDEGFKTASLNLKNYDNPADVVAQDEVTFKVEKNASN